MLPSVERTLALNEYHSYLDILHKKGISYEVPSNAAIEKMDIHDIKAIVVQLKAIARTPSD